MLIVCSPSYYIICNIVNVLEFPVSILVMEWKIVIFWFIVGYIMAAVLKTIVANAMVKW